MDPSRTFIAVECWSSHWIKNALGGTQLVCKETNRSFLGDGSLAILFPRLGSLFSRTFLHRAPFVLWISYWRALAARFQRKWDDFQDGRGKILVDDLRVTQRSIVFGVACTASTNDQEVFEFRIVTETREKQRKANPNYGENTGYCFVRHWLWSAIVILHVTQPSRSSSEKRLCAKLFFLTRTLL